MLNIATCVCDAVISAIIACVTMFFGEHWFIFALFLFLNIVDVMTGWMKARITQQISPTLGVRGMIKKLGYWIMIAFSFMIAQGFVELGDMLNIDLGLSPILGWFVIASLIVNEARSVSENFIAAGYEVPKILVKGLEIANVLINKEEKK